jgi:branched-chain amino acid transport system substrate-binding protein
VRRQGLFQRAPFHGAVFLAVVPSYATCAALSKIGMLLYSPAREANFTGNATMLTRRTAIFSLTTIAAGMSAGLAGCGPKLPETLKIGVLIAQTGASGPRGKDLLRGAEMAAEDINAAGYKIAGRAVRIEIVPFDDKSETEEAVKGAQQLLASGVHAIIGPLNTPQAQKTIPLIAEYGLPNMFTTTAAALHSQGKGNTFRLLANDDLQGRAAAIFTHENLRAQRVAVIHDSGDYGKGLHKAFAEQLAKSGGKIGSVFSVDAKADVTVEITGKIKAENADLIMLFSREQQLKSLFKSLQEVGHTKVTVVGTNVIRNASVAAAQIPVSALYATATAIDAMEFHNGRDFVDAFEKKFKERPLWGAHYSYDAVYALASAASAAQTVEPAKLVNWLTTKEPITRVNHQMRWDNTGEQRYASIAVYLADRGAWQLQMRSSQW